MTTAKAFVTIALLAGMGAPACSPKEEQQSQLQTLRVLAVRKDKPYAAPGDTVKLEILYDDGVPLDTDAAPNTRPIQVLWVSGCTNPLADLYQGCFIQLAEAAQKGFTPGQPTTGDAGASKGSHFDANVGPRYSFGLPSDIISSRPPPIDHSPPYGLAYVFFFVCAGQLGPAPAGQEFPIACFSKSGAQLGADSFVAGYTAVYAYDSIRNKNPVLKGFQIDSSSVDPECIDDGCVAEEGAPAPPSSSDAGAPEAGVLEGGVSDGGASGNEGGAPKADAAPARDGGTSASADPCANPKAATCIEVCDPGTDQSDCPEHDIKLVTEASVEQDTVSKIRDNQDIFEQSWINYYVDEGNLKNDVKLLSDATGYYNEDHGTKLRAPKKLGRFHVWAVAHDNRGGASWLKVELATRAK